MIESERMRADEKELIKQSIENLKTTLMNRSFSLELTLMDNSDETRLGVSHYPFAHLKLEVPEKYTPKLVRMVENLYEIDFLQLSLFVNILTEMQNAYCSILMDSCIVKYFLKRDIGTVSIWDPADRMDLIHLGLEFCSKTGEKEGDRFRPFKYNNVPAKDFNKWLSKTEDIEILKFEPDFPEDEIRKQLEEYNQNPLRYRGIFDFKE